MLGPKVLKCTGEGPSLDHSPPLCFKSVEMTVKELAPASMPPGKEVKSVKFKIFLPKGNHSGEASPLGADPASTFDKFHDYIMKWKGPLPVEEPFPAKLSAEDA